ncbi:MAG: Maf family protein [Chloroflexi bacterium]|nr:Maf family protein [Chloroflexota bacterium]
MQRPPLILASTSPRRRELITLLGLAFEPTSSDVDETALAAEAPADLVRRLSRAKAQRAMRAHPIAIVVAADTVVSIDGRILGKPRDGADARRILLLLRGRAHTVYTGITVANSERQITQTAATTVWMRDYGADEIDAYIATGDPFDKAAAYAIQHDRFHPVARIEGCHANVMGLPLCHLYLALERFGVPLAEPDRACQAHLGIECPVARPILQTGDSLDETDG